MDNLSNEITNLINVCRVCLIKTTDMIAINKKYNHPKSIIAMLSSLANFEIDFNENTPRFICIDCEEKLGFSYDFQQLIKRSQQFIEDSLSTTTNQIEETKITVEDEFVYDTRQVIETKRLRVIEEIKIEQQPHIGGMITGGTIETTEGSSVDHLIRPNKYEEIVGDENCRSSCDYRNRDKNYSIAPPPPPPTTRKHVALTIKQKYEVLEKLRKGSLGKDLAKEYNVGSSTISDIKRNSEKIRKFVEKCICGPGNKKSLRTGEYPKMESELYNWYLIQKQRAAVLNYDRLAVKAKQLYEKYYNCGNFRASQGWLSNFKKRYGIQCIRAANRDKFDDMKKTEHF